MQNLFSLLDYPVVCVKYSRLHFNIIRNHSRNITEKFNVIPINPIDGMQLKAFVLEWQLFPLLSLIKNNRKYQLFVQPLNAF